MEASLKKKKKTKHTHKKPDSETQHSILYTLGPEPRSCLRACNLLPKLARQDLQEGMHSQRATATETENYLQCLQFNVRINNS